MDGIIVINKEKGCTSHDVVYKVKKLFGVKVGHTGTLDPNATGVLPILIGKGTELSQYLINHDKKYIATIKLGVKTDTADIEGNVIEERDIDLSTLDDETIEKVLKSLIGRQKQVPPMYSAIKVNGKKLYEYARCGKKVDIPEREIEIYSLKLIDLNKEEKKLTFEIFCSKGTYVRTVCEKISEALGTVGYMVDLKRTLVGDFKIEDSITIEDLTKNIDDKQFIENNVISIEKFFYNTDKEVLQDIKIKKFLNGVILDTKANGLIRIYDEDQKFIGIGEAINGKLKRKIVLD